MITHLAIVEDEEIYANALEDYLVRYQQETENIFEVTRFKDGDDVVHNYKGKYEIILMDIQMKFMDGMSAAEKIRELDHEVIIIFVTNMIQYAIRGYEVDALDYIVKPVEYISFCQKIDRAVERLKSRRQKNFLVMVQGGMKKIDMDNIYFVESIGHYLHFKLGKETVAVRETMKWIEGLLVPYGFFRCHKGYLVNLKHVEEIQDNYCLLGKEHVPVGRMRKKPFLDELAEYISGEL